MKEIDKIYLGNADIYFFTTNLSCVSPNLSEGFSNNIWKEQNIQPKMLAATKTHLPSPKEKLSFSPNFKMFCENK